MPLRLLGLLLLAATVATAAPAGAQRVAAAAGIGAVAGALLGVVVDLSRSDAPAVPSSGP